MTFNQLDGAAADTLTTKTDVIRRSVELVLLDTGVERDGIESVVSSIIKREELGTTGIGRGIAVPHTKSADVFDVKVGCFFLDQPVEFASVDGYPVRLLCIVISPPDRPGDHLRTLEKITRFTKLITDDLLLVPFEELRSIAFHVYQLITNKESEQSDHALEWYKAIVSDRAAKATNEQATEELLCLAAVSCVNLGGMLLTRNLLLDAVDVFERSWILLSDVLSHRPENPVALIYGSKCLWGLAAARASAQNIDSALKMLKDAFALWEHAANEAIDDNLRRRCLAVCYLTSGWKAHQFGKFTESIAWLSRAIQTAEQFPMSGSFLLWEAYRARAVVLAMQGEYELSLADLDECIMLDSRTEILLERAASIGAIGDYKCAEERRARALVFYYEKQLRHYDPGHHLLLPWDFGVRSLQ
jgi:mannitol/fructose-specific phosphotransferase system IIA component (Ntr-type)